MTEYEYVITETARNDEPCVTFEVTFPNRPDLDFRTHMFWDSDHDSWEEVNCDSITITYTDETDDDEDEMTTLQYDILDDLRSRC